MAPHPDSATSSNGQPFILVRALFRNDQCPEYDVCGVNGIMYPDHSAMPSLLISSELTPAMKRSRVTGFPGLNGQNDVKLEAWNSLSSTVRVLARQCRTFQLRESQASNKCSPSRQRVITSPPSRHVPPRVSGHHALTVAPFSSPEGHYHRAK